MGRDPLWHAGSVADDDRRGAELEPVVDRDHFPGFSYLRGWGSRTDSDGVVTPRGLSVKQRHEARTDASAIGVPSDFRTSRTRVRIQRGSSSRRVATLAPMPASRDSEGEPIEILVRDRDLEWLERSRQVLAPGFAATWNR